MKYLQTFFKEKQLDQQFYDFTIDDMFHQMDSEFIIDVIVNHTPKEEQKQIAGVIRMIDFKNGDVHHFLRHLSEGYIRNQMGA